MLNESDYRCRVCGLHQGDPPWGQDGKTPEFDYCPCCGVEFGYQDCGPDSARRFRDSWVLAGAVWHQPRERPEGWSLEAQLTLVPEPFR